MNPARLAELATAPPLRAGQRVDKYVVGQPLGNGRHGQVFEAEHERLGSQVAIKVLTRPDPDSVSRFEHEAQLAARVQHRNVLEVFDEGHLEDGTPYVVMERLRGEALSARMARGPLPVDAAVDLGRQLAAGLAALADAGVVHGDIAPENIVLHHEGDEVVVKLVDFGTYRATGPPSHVAPEQLRGEAPDVRSDLYAVGVLLYECLTGHLPYEGETPDAVAVAVLDEPVPTVTEHRPSCPRELDSVVMQLMAKDPRARHQDPRLLAIDLDRLVEALDLYTGSLAWEEPTELGGPIDWESGLDLDTEPRPMPPPPRARRWWVIVVVLLALGLLAAVAPSWIERARSDPPPGDVAGEPARMDVTPDLVGDEAPEEPPPRRPEPRDQLERDESEEAHPK